jgi:hypothetical protein
MRLCPDRLSILESQNRRGQSSCRGEIEENIFGDGFTKILLGFVWLKITCLFLNFLSYL